MKAQALLQGLATGKARPVGPMGYAGRAADATGRVAKDYDTTARSVQEALVQLLQERGASGAPNVHMGSMRDTASRMAGSDAALMGLKAVPAVAALAGLGLKDEDESFANQAMDLLGMGAGAYGIHRGINRLGGTTVAGAGLRVGDLVAAGGAGMGAALGNMGVNAVQGLVGI